MAAINGKTDIARKYRDEYGMEMPIKTLARILHDENKAIFKDIEQARNYLCKIEGKRKGRGRKANGTTISHPHPERPRNPYSIPEPDEKDIEPYTLPTHFNNFIFASDFHVPNHHDLLQSRLIWSGVMYCLEIRRRASLILLNCIPCFFVI